MRRARNPPIEPTKVTKDIVDAMQGIAALAPGQPWSRTQEICGDPVGGAA